jgi:hypothetical protein
MILFAPLPSSSQQLVQEAWEAINASRPYTAWEADARGTLQPVLQRIEPRILYHTTMEEWITSMSSSTTKIQLLNGTTVVSEPYHVDNMFHCHNDFILSEIFRLFTSGLRTRQPPSFSQSPQSPLRLYLTHGNYNRRYNRRVIAMEALHVFYNEILYPLEAALSQPSLLTTTITTNTTTTTTTTPIPGGNIICFEQVLWGGRSYLPYYPHVGRFGRHHEWKGVVPAFGHWVYQAYNISPSATTIGTTITANNNVKDKKDTPTNSITINKPKLTWVDRPCITGGGGGGRPDNRCFHKAADVIAQLRTKFDVQILSFNRTATTREQQFHTMLQQMSQTNILVGMHGAGLGHIVYLPSFSNSTTMPTMVVEIKSLFGRDNILFLNMASLQDDTGYYMWDVGAVSTAQGVSTIPEENITNFVHDLYTAWEHEVQYKQNKKMLVSNTTTPTTNTFTTGECTFPFYTWEYFIGKKKQIQFSRFEDSRCYLQYFAKTKEWRQCVAIPKPTDVTC